MRSSKMFKKITSFALVAAMIAPMVVSTPANVDAAKKVKLSKSSFYLATGQKKTIKVKNASTKAKITWKSSNKKVLAIKAKKANATVTAKSAGTARVSCVVKVGKKKTPLSLTVKVRQTVKTAAMQDSSSKACTSKTIKVNEQITLKAAINNNASGSTTNQVVKWSSSNTKIATVKKSNVNSAKVTGKGKGSATITAIVAPNSKKDKKVITCNITVDGVQPTPTPTQKTSPTPTPFPKGVIYKQRNDVTRWYDPATADKSENGHAHDGYKNNNFAIWMVGFFDNKYSTNEEEYVTYGPDLTNVFNAQYTGTKDPKTGEEKGHDYRGETLNIKGDFSYEGSKSQKTILLQINYTKPDDYPIMHKWEKGASTWKGDTPQKNLGLTGTCGDEELAPNKTGKVDVTFTIPKDAKNGDTDSETGKNFGIYIYFPNRPGGALAYRSENTFHFKNFIITEK